MIKKNLIILCYHGVIDDKKKNGIENYSGKHILKKEFTKQLKFLKKKNCEFLSLDKVVENIKKKITFKKNSFCITFDDGFENNFTIAAPILKKLNIPAIFFLCPKNIDKQQMFWVDKIEACINLTSKKKIKIKSLNNNNYNIETDKKKIEIIKKIKNFCKNNKNHFKNNLISELIKETKIKPSFKSGNTYKVAKWISIRKTLKSKLFTIGGHSLEHDIFTMVSKKNIKKNISETIKILSKKTNQKIKYFSYPEGQKKHYNNYVIKILKKNKIVCCPSAINGKNSHLENLFHLKRTMVGFNNIKLPKLQ